MIRRIAVAVGALVLVIVTGAVQAPPAHAADRVTLPQLLQKLPVTAEVNKGYDRGAFRHWITIDGCSAREWVLIQEAVAGRRSGCDVTGGRWVSRYDGQTTADPGSFDIDHLVPLAEAWGLGA